MVRILGWKKTLIRSPLIRSQTTGHHQIRTFFDFTDRHLREMYHQRCESWSFHQRLMWANTPKEIPQNYMLEKILENHPRTCKWLITMVSKNFQKISGKIYRNPSNLPGICLRITPKNGSHFMIPEKKQDVLGTILMFTSGV